MQQQNIPIVLIHGLGGFDVLFKHRRPSREYFPGVRQHLESYGYRVLMPRLSGTGSVRNRAMELRAILHRELGTTPAHLVGHSMGGLDARYLITRLGFGEQALSLTTIGCPHRGSVIADWAMKYFGRACAQMIRRLGLCADAFADLTTTACSEFNAVTPDLPGVRYFSIAGVIDRPWMAPIWRWPSTQLNRVDGANDGVVSVTSATWGESTELWQADHLNLVNWPNERMRKVGEWNDRAPHYRALLSRMNTPAH